MARTRSRESISTRQHKIAALGKIEPKRVLTTLAHHVDEEWLHEAYRRTRKDKAAGVDGVTAAQYEESLEANVSSLLDRFKSGLYRAPPVRRVHIPKGDGSQDRRPIGIPTLEDKVLQRAVLMLLEPVYEQDFLPCSYGFRPGRSPHQALEALWQGLMEYGGGWVLDVDIRQYFERIDRRQLRSFLDQRVRDGVVRRAIGKWLNAGVMEEGQVRHPERGTPQGGVISPLLSNIYLHEVLDMWFEHEVRPRLAGRARMVRFADDVVMVFETEQDARRVWETLPKRLGRFGLELHPDKARLVDFRRPSGGPGTDDVVEVASFDTLGFTHHWGRSRKGRWVVKRKTARNRLARALVRLNAWCQVNRHKRVAEQWVALGHKVRGHYSYFGVTGNMPALRRFHHRVERCWRRWLTRRSWQAKMPWSRFQCLLARYPIPPPRVVHSVYRQAANP